ncbi:MAG: hypothetical protein ACM3U1_04135 [Chloroflexota bacterium]
MNYSRFAFIMALAYLFPFFCSAEDEWKIYPYYYKNDTIAYVNAIAPLKDGGMLVSPWMRLYTINEDEIEPVSNPDLSSDYYAIHRMQTDSKGTIWINTLGGLAKYTEEGGFQKVSKLDYGSKWDYGAINGLTVDNNDNVWFLSTTQYLTKFDGEKFTDYDIDKIEMPYFNTNRVIVKDSILRYAYPKGIVEVTFHTQDSLSHKTITMSEAKLGGKNIRFMQFDRLGNLYASSDSNDLSFYSDGKWEAVNIPDSLKIHGEEWDDKYIKKIVPIKDGQIYVFWAMHYFFCKYDLKKDKWEKIDYPIDDSVVIWLGSAEFDSEGYLWIGTGPQGIFRYKPEGTGAPEGGYGAENHALDAWIERIYPNPTRGNILKARAFLMPDGQDNVTAYVSDILGNKLIEFSGKIQVDPTTGEANLEYSLEGLPNGTYLFVLQNGVSIRAKNFVKID